MTLWILCALVFAGVLCALQGTLVLVTESTRWRRARSRERALRSSSQHAEAELDEGQGILVSEKKSALQRFALGIPGRRRLELLLYRAGLGDVFVKFVAAVLVLSLSGFAAGFWILRSAPIGSALLGLGLLPFLYVGFLKRSRMALFESQLPEALDLICRALRAGISLEFGLRSVGEELADPVGTEFAQIADEVSRMPLSDSQRRLLDERLADE